MPEINWLQVISDTIDIAAYHTQLIRGTGMDSDLVPLFAILLFVGGILFWVGLVFAFFVGAFRLVMRGIWAVMDVFPVGHASGGKIAEREPREDEVGPFILDPQHD